MKKLTDVLKIRKSAWFKFGILIKKWLTQDAIKGLTQGNEIGYKSIVYKDYKSRGMKAKTLKRKVKPYDGVAIKSRKTGTINMMLTGQLFRGLFPSGIIRTRKYVTGVIMAYKNKDAGKIEGNEDRGVNVRTLNEKNIKKAQKEIMRMLDKPIKEYVNEKIIIKV